MMGFRTQFVRRDGLELHLHVQEGEGPIVFIQHGLCGDAAQPATIFPRNAGFRLAVLECRGHGESVAGSPEAFSIATFANDVAAAIEAMPQRPIAVGGISMGAAIAMRLACTQPELVRSLVLARPAWTTAAAPANMRPNLIVGEILRKPPQPEEVAAFLETETAKTLAAESPDNLASLTGFFRREPRAVTAELLTRISADGPGVSLAQLAAIAVPTLVIGNSEDFIHPLTHARDLARAIPHARFLEIPPKTHGKEAYEAAFRTGLGKFLQERRDE